MACAVTTARIAEGGRAHPIDCWRAFHGLWILGRLRQTTRRARRYHELIALLEDLGKRLDSGAVSLADIREWKRQVLLQLSESEIGIIMAGADDDEFDVDALPEHRWSNLKKVLLDRKGLGALK